MRSFCRSCYSWFLVLALVPPARGQVAADSSVTRGPRFLLLAAAMPPQPVDIRRTPVLRERLTLDLRDVPLKTALAVISAQSGLELVYSDDVLPVGALVRLRADGITVAAALTDVLIDADVDVVFNQAGRAALVRRAVRAVLQRGRVSGRVTDARTGQPIVGASVVLAGTSWHATTDDGGHYRLADVTPGTYTLSASRIGYAKTSQPVTVTADQEATADFALRAAPTVLDQVVVTATKTAAKIQDVPAAVELVDSAAIANAGAKTVLEALRSVAGVTDASYGENFQSIQLRGLPRLGNENETVLLLIDGVPQTDSRNSARLTTMPIDNVDQIEVVKGPNSALYGRTAIGGVINFITRDPPPHAEFRADVQTGAWDYVRANASAGAPTDSAGSGYLVSWQGEQRESPLSPATKRHESSIFGKFKQIIDPRTQFWVTANYASSLGGTPAPIPYAANGQLLSDADPSFSLYSNLNLPYAAYNQDEVRVSMHVSRDLSTTARVEDVLGYRHFKYQFVNDGDCVAFTPPDTVVLFPFSEVQQEDYYYNDLRLESTVTTGKTTQHVLLGGSFERNQGNAGGDIEYTDTVSFGVPVIYNNPQYPTVNQLQTSSFGPNRYRGDFWGFYVQDEVSLTDRWHISAGARYDRNHLTATRSPSTAVEATYTKVSPKIGVSYRLLTGGPPGGAELTVYGQYSRAFKPPRAPSALSQTDTIKLFPEDVRNWEGGIKASLLENRLAMEVSAFDMDRTGIPIVVRVVAQEFKTVNGGEQKFSGVEVGVQGRPASAVMCFAKYAYYNGRYGTYQFNNNGTPTDLTGNRVALSPKHQVDLGLDVTAGAGLTFELEGHYKGSRYLNSFNTALLPSYFVTDGRVSWQVGRYRAALGATNLFDEKYATDGDITYGTFVFPAAPRRLVAELGANF
jgi:TonB-dependent siderophore receptor